MTKNIFCLLLLACTAACVTPEYTRSSRNSLDRAIRYTEVPRHENPITLSGAENQFVPDGKEVDIDSRITIHIDSAALKLLGTAGAEDTARLYPDERLKKLNATLVKLNKTIEARLKAVAAFESVRALPMEERKNSQAFSEFSRAVAEYGGLRREFNLLPIWEDGTFSEEEVEPAFEDKTYAAVGVLLQREIDLAEAAMQRTIEEVDRHTASLKLAAFLQSAQGDVAPIHLEGYDLYTNKDVKLKDGFVMDADARKAFEEQYSQTVELARQVEKVRSGESSFNDALMTSGISSLKEIKERIDSFRPLLETDWSATLNTLQKEVLELNTKLSNTLRKYGKDEEAMLRINVSSVSAALSSDLSVAEIKDIVTQATALTQEWKGVKPETLVDVFNKTALLKTRVTKLATDAKTIKLVEASKSLDSLRDSVVSRPAEISDEIWREYRPQVEQSRSYMHLRQLCRQFQSLRQFVQDAPDLLGFTNSGGPLKADLNTPEIKEVPLAEAPDTNIELPRTSRMSGDRVFVSAALKVGDTEVMKSDSLFVVKYFNWHPHLSSNVILTKAANPKSNYDGDYKFEPSVSWVFRYYPRDTNNILKGLAKFFQPGFGLHAAFLDQSVQKDAEIGIGGTVSLWDDRIVTGFGINLMNNSKGYFYIGSDLISLLQGAGSRKESNKKN